MSECKHVLQVPQLNGRVRCEKCNVWFDSWTHATEIVALNSRIAELEQQLAKEREANRWIPVSKMQKKEGAYIFRFSDEYGDYYKLDELYLSPISKELIFNDPLSLREATHFKPITAPQAADYAEPQEGG